MSGRQGFHGVHGIPQSPAGPRAGRKIWLCGRHVTIGGWSDGQMIRLPLLVSLNCNHAQDFQPELHFMNKVRNVKVMAIWTGDHVVFIRWELQMTFYFHFSLD